MLSYGFKFNFGYDSGWETMVRVASGIKWDALSELTRNSYRMDRDKCGCGFSRDEPQDTAFRLGYQGDSGAYYAVIAHSEHGCIPGKARAGVAECWYPYGGEECQSEDFEWLSGNGCTIKLKHAVSDVEPPKRALVLGCQEGEDEPYYMAVCHTDEGDIPGKAKADGCAWYSFGGAENESCDFSWIVCRPSPRAKLGLDEDCLVHLRHMHGGEPEEEGEAPPPESSIRIHEDNSVDGTGGRGPWASWKVHLHQRDGTMKFENFKMPGRFLACRRGELTTGSGGRFCDFRVRSHKNGTCSLESVNNPGRHVGINDDLSARSPKETGRGINGRFYMVPRAD